MRDFGKITLHKRLFILIQYDDFGVRGVTLVDDRHADSTSLRDDDTLILSDVSHMVASH